MSGATRAGLLALAALVLVGAFIAFNGTKKKSTEPAKQTTATAQKSTSDKPNSDSTTTKPAETKTGQPEAEAADAADAKVPILVGGKVQTITVNKGELVHFKVLSKVKEEVHVHGYNLAKDLPANKPVDMQFKATLDGVFEIEFEHSGTKIAKLKVLP